MPKPDFAAEASGIAGKRLGRYELIRRIAYGGMAEIFLARDEGVQGFSRNVVVKRILPNITEDPVFVKMFLEEARIVARLSHQNIAHVYDFGEEDGQFFIAMEYVDGLALHALLNVLSPKPVPVAHAIKVTSLVASALFHAHGLVSESGTPMGIVHRDISPQNVLLSWDGQVKLVDFGIAKAADQMSHTEVGVLKGKFAYLAPERCLGLEYDHRTDIFSLGTVLYEMLTGSRLFKRDNPFQTMKAVTTDPIEPPSARIPSLPARLDRLVMKALARKPDERYQSADELSLDLEEVLQKEGLISTSIHLGRFLEKVLPKDHRDGGAGAGRPKDRQDASSSDSAPSWSLDNASGDGVTESEISQLRRVAEGKGKPKIAPPSFLVPPLSALGIKGLVAPGEGHAETSDIKVPTSKVSAGRKGASRPAFVDAKTEEVPGSAERTIDITSSELSFEDENIEPASSSFPTEPPTSPRTASLDESGEISLSGPHIVVEASTQRGDPSSDAAVLVRPPPMWDEASSRDSTGSISMFSPSSSGLPRWIVYAGAAGVSMLLLAIVVFMSSRSCGEAEVATDGTRGTGTNLVADPVTEPLTDDPSKIAASPNPTGPQASKTTQTTPPLGEAPPSTEDLSLALTGTLVVRASKVQKIFVDGDSVDEELTREGMVVEAGVHEVVVIREGQSRWSKTVLIEEGSTEVLTVPAPSRTTPTGPPGALFVNSRPWSKVYLGSRRIGATPIVGHQIRPGRHRLKLVSSDGRQERRTVTIRSGRPTKVFVPFE